MEGSTAIRRSSRLLCGLLAAVMLFQTSCGTILYPDRRGQKSGNLDVAVILLDGACLLIFVIPGIVAFAVDFATGAIYLPAERSSGKQFHEVRVAPADLTPQRLEEIVLEQTGKTVHLAPGTYHAMRLESIDQFTPQTVSQLQADPAATEVTFAAASEQMARTQK